MQTTHNILMIRPVSFGFNTQTASSNAFQDPLAMKSGALAVQQQALDEFNGMVKLLENNGVNVIVVDDTTEPHKPDSIFPNNWVSFHDDGTLCLYPMQAPNRRLERRADIIDALRDEKKFKIGKTLDFTHHENSDRFLEGTGSLVLDRVNKIAYACLSPRTFAEILDEFTEQTGYRVVAFNSVDSEGRAIYHTNVVMSVGDTFAVVCLETIRDEAERSSVLKALEATGHDIISISLNQMNQFAGNMLQIRNQQDESLLVMSEQAYKSLNQEQISRLESHARILHAPLYTIESNGGGSARCMMAEVHLPVQEA
jgi:hypothetical protein